jgi:hypothetical protein
VSQACPLFLVFPGTFSTPLSPPLVLEVGIVPQVPTASASPHIWTLKWVYEELGGATPPVSLNSNHPWHLARPPVVATLACFFNEQEAGGS